MISKDIHCKIHFWLAIAIAFSLPLAKLTPLLIILMLLNWLIEKDFKAKIKTVINNKLTIIFISLYILHIFGLFYTSNLDAGKFDLQVKLSLFIMPILITSRPFNATQIQNIFLSLLIGSLVASFIMLVHSLFLYSTTLEMHHLTYQYFSYFIHPSYFSMYLNCLISWLVISYNQSTLPYIINTKSKVFFLISFLSIIVIMLSSRVGMFTLGIIFISVLFYIIFIKKKYAIAAFSIGLICLSIAVTSVILPLVVGRISEFTHALTNTKKTNTNTHESTSVRFLIWDTANYIIQKNFFLGVGTGDVKDELLHEYENRSMIGALDKSLNAHNQYYQTFIGLGLFGFILLLSTFIVPSYIAFTNFNYIYVSFVLIFMLNCLAESMFETQAGTMFYGFLNAILHKKNIIV